MNGKPCVVIEQEFQASDSGDDWPETSAEVITRLTRSLMPRLEGIDATEHSFSGVVADAQVTFCGRPTVYLALPAERTRPEAVVEVLRVVRTFAYPTH